jgi:hypothetical protein
VCQPRHHSVLRAGSAGSGRGTTKRRNPTRHRGMVPCSDGYGTRGSPISSLTPSAASDRARLLVDGHPVHCAILVALVPKLRFGTPSPEALLLKARPARRLRSRHTRTANVQCRRHRAAFRLGARRRRSRGSREECQAGAWARDSKLRVSEAREPRAHPVIRPQRQLRDPAPRDRCRSAHHRR